MKQIAKEIRTFSEDLSNLPVSNDFYAIFLKTRVKDIIYFSTRVYLEQLIDTNHKATFRVFCRECVYN